jgi:Arc/MetJ family transcription regulator
LTAQGLSRAQIAERLSISVTTVASHRAKVLRKLGLHTPADLVRYAVRRGIGADETPPSDDQQRIVRTKGGPKDFRAT